MNDDVTTTHVLSSDVECHMKKKTDTISSENTDENIDEITDENTDETTDKIETVVSETSFQDVTLPVRRMTKLKTPPASWRAELDENLRKCQWRYAAGLNNDGSEKTSIQHATARASIFDRTKADKIKAAKENGENERTEEEKCLVLAHSKVNAVRLVQSKAACILRQDEIRLIHLKDEKDITEQDRVIISNMENRNKKHKLAKAVRVAAIKEAKRKDVNERTGEEKPMILKSDNAKEASRIQAKKHRKLPGVYEVQKKTRRIYLLTPGVKETIAEYQEERR